MSRQRLSMIAASLIVTSPLAAQWVNWNAYQIGYSAPYLEENCSNRYYGELDYLLWFANQEGLCYATIDRTSTITSTDNTRDLFFSNRLRSGVRATLGFKPQQRTWDISASYTYFSTKIQPKGLFESLNNTSYTSDQGSLIANQFIPNPDLYGPYPDVNLYLASTSWKLNFSQIDLNLSNDFAVSNDVNFRPYFGLRSVWTNQKLLYDLTVGLAPIDANPTSSNSFLARQQFGSVGIQAGFDASFTLGWGLDLFGNLGGSILWGRFKVNQSYTNFYDSDGSITDFSTQEMIHNHYTSLLNLDVGFGIRWNYNFVCGHLLSLKFAWEQHIYTNMNQIKQFNSFEAFTQELVGGFALDRNVRRGDLTLSGFVFGVDYTY